MLSYRPLPDDQVSVSSMGSCPVLEPGNVPHEQDVGVELTERGAVKVDKFSQTR